MTVAVSEMIGLQECDGTVYDKRSAQSACLSSTSSFDKSQSQIHRGIQSAKSKDLSFKQTLTKAYQVIDFLRLNVDKRGASAADRS